MVENIKHTIACLTDVSVLGRVSQLIVNMDSLIHFGMKMDMITLAPSTNTDDPYRRTLVLFSMQSIPDYGLGWSPKCSKNNFNMLRKVFGKVCFQS